MNENKNVIKCIKIGLLGDTFVGKTAICNSIMNVEFSHDLLATVGHDKLETIFILKNGENIKLILWDTCGAVRFRSFAFKALKSVQGIVIVFDLTKKETFDNLKFLLDEIKETYYNPRLVLFGNKSEMQRDQWEVTTEEAKKYAESHNLPYFEVSAKTKQGINEGLSYIVNDIYENFDEIKTGIRIKTPMDEKSGCAGKTKHKKQQNK